MVTGDEKRSDAGRKWWRGVLWSQPIMHSRFLCIGLPAYQESSRRCYGKDGKASNGEACRRIHFHGDRDSWRTWRRLYFRHGGVQHMHCSLCEKAHVELCSGGNESKCLHLMKSLLATTQSECTCWDIRSQMKTPFLRGSNSTTDIVWREFRIILFKWGWRTHTYQPPLAYIVD